MFSFLVIIILLVACLYLSSVYGKHHLKKDGKHHRPGTTRVNTTFYIVYGSTFDLSLHLIFDLKSSKASDLSQSTLYLSLEFVNKIRKMLLKRNLLETVTIISCSGTILCVFLNYITNISPLTGVWFLCYILLLFITSVVCSFKFMQWLLHLNKPIKYDIEKILNQYPFLAGVLPQVSKKIEKQISKEYDTNELSVISTVLEKRLVSSWYVSYISEEIGFPFACKQLLDEMIAKAFQICDKIESKDVYVDMCAILISHLKEYKKALKRQETTPDATVESLYKKTHPVSNDNNKNNLSADHCINLLRIVLKELVPWELWDTPYSELLVRILAKKLNTFIENTISNPVWLNDRLLMILNVQVNDEKKEEKSNINEKDKEMQEKCGKSEQDVIDTKKQEIGKTLSLPEKEGVIPQNIEKKGIQDMKTTIKPVKSSTAPHKSTESPIQFQKIVEEHDIKKDEIEDSSQGSEPVEIKPILRKNRGRQGRNEVKIYDRIIEGSVKTWETDMDLQCISVGQDLLASLDEMTLSRLWGQEDTEHSPSLRGTSPLPLWFGEEDAIELDNEFPKELKKESEFGREHGPKPGDALLKDLQSTVHQAKAKIGDLQVLHIDVPPQTSDEAAGMMEGLLDKGIAGLKKGLRFTGLSDDSQEKLAVLKDRAGEKISPSELYRSRPKPEVDMEAKEAYFSTNMQKEENGNPIHPLVKQHRVTSQDSMMKARAEWSPPAEALPESPEPQYEEAADLSASIAKLRSLLQHVERPRAEEVWWEGAEETRGRAQKRPSSKPVDSASLADEYDTNLERNASPGQSSNNMQRLDKLFTRTVTGVFNSIRTAVGAEGLEDGDVTPRQAHDWTYVCTSPDLGLGAVVGRLVGKQRALRQVDTALDSLRELPAPPAPPLVPLDLEEWCSGAGARWCGSCEAACAAGLAASHLAFRLATVLTADIAESLICSWLHDLTAWLRRQVFAYFEQLSRPGADADRKLREFRLEETCAVVLDKIPETYLFSEQTLSEAVRLVVCSFSHQRVNRDVIFRALDILVVHFKKSAGLRNPSFDAN